ncbi:MAG: trypsin-like peptidase domain-containing protein [Balneolaceae bacterium]
MKLRDKLLSGVLLVLIGVLIGMILMFFRQGNFSFDRAEVRVTEVNRSDTPFWTNEDLEKIDDRFVFRSVAKTITPTVVYIETIVPARNRGLEPDSEDDERFWQRFLPPRARTVGSGVVISDDGYILTNNHVIEDAVKDGITVTMEDKRVFEARIVGTDPSTDLAVIKVDAQELSTVVIGNSDQIEVGEWVLAIGNPFRLRSTVTAGIVSALSRDVQIINDELRIESFIQTDAAINRGNSGGALVNTSGELIGINTAIASQSGSYQGYGFAVPSNLALKVARDLIEFGEVKRGMLGVSIQSVDSEMARDAGFERIAGVMVMEVTDNSAAHRGGIRASDIVLKVNEDVVNESNQLQEKVAMYRPSDQITLTIWRNGEELERVVELDELQRPEPEEVNFEEDMEIPPRPEQEWDEIPENEGDHGIEQQRFQDLGFTIRALATPEDPEQFNLYIWNVERNSEAWNRGIREGHEIVEINNSSILNLSDAKKEITDSVENNRSLNLKILTEDGATGFYKLN